MIFDSRVSNGDGLMKSGVLTLQGSLSDGRDGLQVLRLLVHVEVVTAFERQTAEVVGGDQVLGQHRVDPVGRQVFQVVADFGLHQA